MTVEKIRIEWPDELNYGIQTFEWPYESGVDVAFGIVAELCDGNFLYAPFATQTDAEEYVIDDSYCFPQISCEGATPLIHFPPLFVGQWDLYVDAVLVAEDADAGDLYTALNAEFGSILFVDQDGYFRIENLSDQPLRFKLVPKVGASHEPPEDSTPAYTENEDGSIEFCLAEAE